MTQPHIAHTAELVVRAVMGRPDFTPAAVVQALADAALLRTAPPEVYRASWDDQSLGLYASRDAARGRCLLAAAIARPEARMSWHPTNGDDDAEEFLADGGENTEYYITTVPVRMTAGEI
ncbi:hypothetical protein ACIQOW_08540 [Kitasatospora sp. NPDC091335]|uniref:hypothetical protein n=1 Tax=Kitasatospora sp. NPDC091335 TaxID=3364085 RepID=UPI0038144DBF